MKRRLTIACVLVSVALILCMPSVARAYPITQLTFEPSYEGQPAWSPDGNKIAFVTDRDGNREIYVMNADGTNQGRLTFNEYDDIEPDWSPDGNKIVFSSDRSGNYDIYIMKANGSNQTRLSSESSNEREPAWRYNENKLLYHDPYWNGTIYIMNADGSAQMPIETGRYPSWSSDGTKIAFASNKHGGTPQIYIMNPDGSEQHRLTFIGKRNSEPKWSPHGTKIAFSINKLSFIPEGDFFPDLYIMDTDGSNLQRLTYDEYFYTGFKRLRRSPTWSPDGTKIAYHYKGDIYVISGIPEPPTIPAWVDITPDILNLKSKGKWITCYIWLPEDYNVADIEPNSVVLESEPNDIYAEWIWFEEWQEEEYAMAKFKRCEVQDILEPGEVELVVSGELIDGTVFEGTDVIKVIDKGGKKK